MDKEEQMLTNWMDLRKNQLHIYCHIRTLVGDPLLPGLNYLEMNKNKRFKT